MNIDPRMGALLLLLAVAGASLAQTAPTDRATFASLDRNRDGRVSDLEARAHDGLRASFESLDADRDSYLTQAEFSKWINAAPAAPVLPPPVIQDRETPTSPDDPPSRAEGQSPPADGN